MTGSAAKQRIDKWLWQARFFKTRTLAARVVSDGRVRLNGVHVTKTSATVGPGDALTFPQGDRIRVVIVRGLPTRRGPASEAQTLYDDESPAPVPRSGPRPTGRDRRKLDREITRMRARAGTGPGPLE
ncbi:RNA-binding S4 domain-containing protein [Jannaschia marina]|uniref:RNA-binding S4 domain-containing protein n=1 Tax=Jannaschia marina TaxID=2741674 RepID=UPI0015CA1E3C|nr:RNA-binding S4 domain-containing protein [Jannaschia marina]